MYPRYLLLLFMFVFTSSIRDDWLESFIRANTNAINDKMIASIVSKDESPSNLCAEKLCLVKWPKYIPPREFVKGDQVIPRSIFLSWKSDMIGVNHFQSIRKWVLVNPDYEIFFFDDEDIRNFMCSHFPDFTYVAFSTLIPGAAKVDMWRYAIVYIYGGIYIDADCFPNDPLRTWIWPNASLVTGRGAGEINQYMIVVAPRHPVMLAAVRLAGKRSILTYLKRGRDFVHFITGPTVLSVPFKKMIHDECGEMTFGRAITTKFIDVRRNQSDETAKYYCGEKLGVLQIYADDYMGFNVIPKSDGSTKDMTNQGYVRYELQHEHHERLFRRAEIDGSYTKDGTVFHRINRCDVKDGRLVRMYVDNVTIEDQNRYKPGNSNAYV